MTERPLDQIHIIDLLLRCIVGVYDNERRDKQDVVINLTLYADLSRAGKSDQLEDTVDYKTIKQRVIEMVEQSQFFLIEALAEKIAEICLGDERVTRARVRVEKPGALRFARSVGVEIVRDRRVVAYVAVGSNVDAERNLRLAVELLRGCARVTGVSTFYRTAPLGPAGQPPYLNGVFRVETTLPAREFKSRVLRAIEEQLGRRRGADKYAPRPIDLDLILYGDVVSTAADLPLPHPEIRERPFVAAPLLELAPELILPDDGQPLAALDAAHDCSALDPAMELTTALRARA